MAVAYMPDLWSEHIVLMLRRTVVLPYNSSGRPSLSCYISCMFCSFRHLGSRTLLLSWRKYLRIQWCTKTTKKAIVALQRYG